MAVSIAGVSVIVCTYTTDRWDQLVTAVESLQRQTAPADEVIVVVDFNATLLDRVRNDLPMVRAVRNTFAHGLSGARNTGVGAATGAVLAFLDDDAVAEPEWLSHLVRHYSDPRVLGVGGRIDPIWLEGQPRWFPDEFGWVVGCSYLGQPQKTTTVRNLIGCNMSFRREVFETVGGFRTEVGRVGDRPMGCEETELCIRTWQQHPDGIILYEPRAMVSQWVPNSRASWKYFQSRCYAEGLSKALVTRTVGAGAALATERSYAALTLPRGVARGIGAGALGADRSGFSRAAAIIAGLAITATGYASGRAGARLKPGHVVAPTAFRRLRDARRRRAAARTRV